MTQLATPANEFTAMLRLEEILSALVLPGGKTLPYVSTGKNEPDSGEFFAGYFVSDRDSVLTMNGPDTYTAETRVQIIAFARSQGRAFELAISARVVLEQQRFERVGNASVIQRGKLIGVTRDYLSFW